MLEVFRDLEVRGQHTKLDRFLVELDKSLPKRWKRDRAREERIKDFGNIGRQIAYRISAHKGIPAAHVFLWRREDDLYVISNVVPERIGELTKAQYNAIVEEFGEIATPAAQDLGLDIKLTKDKIDISELLAPKSMKALQAFEQSANRSILHPLDSARWRKFLILAHKDGVSLSPDMLTRWFVEERRWHEERAVKLAIEYESALELLKDYDES